MITLLEKKDKDRRFIKNWRPISLINVDVKIASKAIAKRLELFLPELVHHNQNGFIKGRSIFDAVRTIDDYLNLHKSHSKMVRPLPSDLSPSQEGQPPFLVHPSLRSNIGYS